MKNGIGCLFSQIALLSCWIPLNLTLLIFLGSSLPIPHLNDDDGNVIKLHTKNKTVKLHIGSICARCAIFTLSHRQ